MSAFGTLKKAGRAVIQRLGAAFSAEVPRDNPNPNTPAVALTGVAGMGTLANSAIAFASAAAAPHRVAKKGASKKVVDVPRHLTSRTCPVRASNGVSGKKEIIKEDCPPSSV